MNLSLKKIALGLAVCLPISLCSVVIFANESEPVQKENLSIDEKMQLKQIQDAQLFVDVLESMQTFSANFEQISVSNTMSSHQNSTGTLKLKKPGKYAWLTSTPSEEYDVSNGIKHWKYNVDFEEIDINFVNETNSQIMDLFESNQIDLLLSDYEISADRYASETVFTLIPNTNDVEFSHIYLSFVDDKLSSIRIQTDLEQATLIDFKDVVINEEIKDIEFELAIPEGVDVYDNTLLGQN